MSFKLSKDDSRKWDQLHGAAKKEFDALCLAIDKFNEAVSGAREALQGYVDDYNAALEALREHIETIAADWRNEFDEKSETWQSGDRGQEVSEMLDSLENLEISDFELDESEDQTLPATDTLDEIEGLKPE